MLFRALQQILMAEHIGAAANTTYKEYLMYPPPRVQANSNSKLYARASLVLKSCIFVQVPETQLENVTYCECLKI